MPSPEFRRPPVLRQEAPPLEEPKERAPLSKIAHLNAEEVRATLLLQVEAEDLEEAVKDLSPAERARYERHALEVLLSDGRTTEAELKDLSPKERVHHTLAKNGAYLALASHLVPFVGEDLKFKPFKQAFGKRARRKLFMTGEQHRKRAARALKLPEYTALPFSWNEYEAQWHTIEADFSAGFAKWEQAVARVFPIQEMERTLRSLPLPRDPEIMRHYGALVKTFGGLQVALDRMKQYADLFKEKYGTEETQKKVHDPVFLKEVKGALRDVLDSAQACAGQLGALKATHKEFLQNNKDMPRVLGSFEERITLDARRVPAGGPKRLDESFEMIGKAVRGTSLQAALKNHGPALGRLSRFISQADAASAAQKGLLAYGEKVTASLEDAEKARKALTGLIHRFEESKLGNAILIRPAGSRGPGLKISNKTYLNLPVEEVISSLMATEALPLPVRNELVKVARAAGATFSKKSHNKVLRHAERIRSRYGRFMKVLARAEDNGWHRKGKVLRQPAPKRRQ